MKVNGKIFTENDPLRSLQSAKEKAAKSDKTGQGSVVGGGDKIAISSSVRQVDDLAAAAANTPEIRQAKVAEVKEKIASGNFKIDYDLLAERMLGVIKEMGGE